MEISQVQTFNCETSPTFILRKELFSQIKGHSSQNNNNNGNTTVNYYFLDLGELAFAFFPALLGSEGKRLSEE
jgi:hypothetical protein